MPEFEAGLYRLNPIFRHFIGQQLRKTSTYMAVDIYSVSLVVPRMLMLLAASLALTFGILHLLQYMSVGLH